MYIHSKNIIKLIIEYIYDMSIMYPKNTNVAGIFYSDIFWIITTIDHFYNKEGKKEFIIITITINKIIN